MEGVSTYREPGRDRVREAHLCTCILITLRDITILSVFVVPSQYPRVSLISTIIRKSTLEACERSSQRLFFLAQLSEFRKSQPGEAGSDSKVAIAPSLMSIKVTTSFS